MCVVFKNKKIIKSSVEFSQITALHTSSGIFFKFFTNLTFRYGRYIVMFQYCKLIRH